MTAKKKTRKKSLTSSTRKTSTATLQAGFSPRPTTRLALVQAAGEASAPSLSPVAGASLGGPPRRLKRN